MLEYVNSIASLSNKNTNDSKVLLYMWTTAVMTSKKG